MIHGLLVINKDRGMTSHAVVEEIRKLFLIKKVGHFGTLDPFARGVLLVALGFTTKFFNFYVEKKKWYSGKIRFGHATTTYDCEGEPIAETKFVDLYKWDLQSLLANFSGKILQKPPIFSAKKYKGKPLYKYARQDIKVDIQPEAVEIFSLSAEIEEQNLLAFKTQTSAGTYIRSLAHDIGDHIGVGAYLEELTRDWVGEFGLESAITLAELFRCQTMAELSGYVIPIETLLPDFSKVIVDEPGQRSVINGGLLMAKNVVKILKSQHPEYFRLFNDEGKLLAIAKRAVDKMAFQPFIVFPEG